MKKLIFVCLLILSFTLKSSFISHDKIDNNEEVQKIEMTSDGCWKVHFDCGGDKFTKYVKGTSVGDAKSRAKRMYPNCKIGTMTSYSKDRCAD
tara:strand:- start:51 stop:329 length:279 start_codon:yes stop_codon:yes gene_type:complete